MVSRSVAVDLMFTAAAGVATIVCALLSQRFRVKPSLLVRLFSMTKIPRLCSGEGVGFASLLHQSSL